MSTVKSLGKYALYYIAAYLLVSMFVADFVRQPILTIVGAALAIAFFASFFQLLLGGAGSVILDNISLWCVRCAIVLSVLSAMVSLAFSGIVNLFR